MAINAYTLSRQARPTGRGLAEPKLIRVLIRWLAADPCEVVRIPAVAEHASGRGRRLSSSHGQRGPSLAEQSVDSDALLTGLRRWRSRIQRRRAAVLLRRHLIAAAGLAIVLQALTVAGVLAQLVVLAAPLALLLVSMVVAVVQRLTLEQVAHLLDDQLVLFDRIATAVDIQRRPDASGRPLEHRALAEASGLVSASLADLRARAVPNGREWSSLGAALAVLALVATLGGAVHGGSTLPARTGTGAVAGGSGAVASPHPHSGSAVAKPTGKHATLPSTQERANLTRSASAGYRSLTQSSQARPNTSSAGKTIGTSRTSNQHSAGVTAHKPGASPTRPSSSSTAPDDRGLTGVGSHSTQSAISPVSAPSRQAAASTRTTPPSAGKSSSTASDHQSSPSSPTAADHATATGGTPTATQTAGRARASTHLTNTKPVATAPQSSQRLSLQTGYAPSHSGKASKSGNGPGGGGPGRSAAVNGTGSTSAGGQFAYAPSDGGALSEGNPELLLNYSKALQSLKSLQW